MPPLVLCMGCGGMVCGGRGGGGPIAGGGPESAPPAVPAAADMYAG